MSVNWKTVRVFISSTFKDMQSERDHLVRKVFPRIREELLPHKLHFVDIDLRWGVTGEQDAVDVCRELIDESRPYFLCMLGGRYGWIPDGKENSITADEIHYAVIAESNEINPHAFFYFRDPSSTRQMREDHQGQYQEISGSYNERKIKQLKTSVRDAGYRPFVYKPRWDKKRNRFENLEQFGDQVYDDLISAIKNELAQQNRISARENQQVQSADVSAFQSDHLKKFVLGSRSRQYDEVIEYLKSDRTMTSICFYGELGAGRSAFFCYLASVLEEAETFSCTVVPYFCGLDPNVADLRSLFGQLFIHIHWLLGETKTAKDLPRDIEQDLKSLISRFNAKHEQAPLLFLIDGIENLREEFTSSENFINCLSEAKLVFSLRSGKQLVEFQELEKNVRYIELSDLSLDDRRSITVKFLGLFHKKFSDEQIESFIVKQGARNALWLINALEQLRTIGTFEDISNKIYELPDSLPSLFGWILERLARDDIFQNEEGDVIANELVRAFCMALAVSRKGLTYREILDLTGSRDLFNSSLDDVVSTVRKRFGSKDEQRASLIQEHVAMLMRFLRPLLIQTGDLIRFRHSVFQKSSIELFSPAGLMEQHEHRKLGLYFKDQVNRSGSSESLQNIHGRHDLFYHMIRAEAWDDILDIIDDEELFSKLPLTSYGIDYDHEEDSFATSDKESLSQECVSKLPFPYNVEIGFAIADFLAEEAKDLLSQTNRLPRPLKDYASELRRKDKQAFIEYRNLFYYFIFYSNAAASFANQSFDGSVEAKERLEEFLIESNGMGSFSGWLEGVGAEMTGLSHWVESHADSTIWRELRAKLGSIQE